MNKLNGKINKWGVYTKVNTDANKNKCLFMIHLINK